MKHSCILFTQSNENQGMASLCPDSLAAAIQGQAHSNQTVTGHSLLVSLSGMKLKRTLFFLLFTLICNCLLSQSTKFYSTEQGLSSSLINQVYQDKKGFIWIATENGLNKFNGTQFTVYKKIPGDSTSLKGNHVHTLFEDSSGNFWVRCFGGLMKYDRDSDSFREIEFYDEEGGKIYPAVTSICERKNGDVWFASSGIGLFSVKKGETKGKAEALLSDRLNSNFLTVVYEDSNGRLWIGTDNNGLNVYSFRTGELLAYSTSSLSGKRISGDAISAICEGDNGTVFVGTLDGGLNKFDFPEMKISFIRDPDENGRLPVKTLIFDNANQLLVGTDGFGLKKYNPQKQALESYEPFSTPFNFSKSKIHSLLQDKDGNSWAGIFQKGVLFIPANPNGFEYYGYKSFRRNSIGSNCVTAIYKDKEGIIWVGTDNDGLYAIHEKTQHVKHYENTDRFDSVPNTILCIHESDDGQLWLGSYLNGLARFNKQTGKCVYLNNQTHKKLLSNKIHCLTDDNKGGLWIGTYGEGLFKYDIKNQSITEHYYNEANNNNSLVNNWVNVLLYEESGVMWIGTYNGLSRFDTHTNSFRTYNPKNSHLPSNIIFSLEQDRYGNIWIGTNEGLACLNKKTDEIKSYTVNNGLSSNEICAIEEDKEGNLWISTLSGIANYSPIENQFTNYYTSDGLQGNEFSRNAGFQTEDGELFFGGINGITSFFPSEIHAKQKNLNIYTTNFYLFGKTVRRYQKSKGKVIFDTPVLELSKIDLASSDNVFSFEFSTLEYADAEGISYQFKLENFDPDWQNLPPGINRLSYTNLSPGKYTLFFQAFNKDSQSEIKTIEINIRPPWYNTLTAKLIYGILFLLLVYSLYKFIRFRIRQRNEMIRLERVDQINEAKLQFFTNISHEIRTPMTLIMGPLEKLIANNQDDKLQNTYRLIYRNAQRILRLINQLMDMRKIDRGQMQLKARETDMVGFLKDIMQSFEYMAQKKNINFLFKTGLPELNVWVDLNNFDKVLFNVFSNAFKFTPEQGEITVELTTGKQTSATDPLKNFFEIKVLDTGIGIEEEKIDKIFDRFYQVDSEITSSNFGTGIGLHLARSLVELQQGIIFAENRKDRTGSCFTIRMPLGNSHLKRDEMKMAPEQTPATFIYPLKNDLIETNEKDREKTDPVHARTKYRILIVDDDLEINNYIQAELAPIYKIKQMDNGKDALELILKEKPDLIISDVLMPKMDGITLCRKIKSNVNINHIPVLLLTAKSGNEDLAEGLDTGADAYLVKPFNPEILKKTIANLLSNRERLKGKAQQQTEGKIKEIEVVSYNDALMEKILKIVNDNIKNPDLSGETLSVGVGMSRVHLYRKLKELTNQSAGEFIRTIRLKKAGELLASKKLTVSQVYNEVGFTNFSYFSTCFKEFYGVSPKDFPSPSSERR
jgi:ligand-binding sensor domain-containing protein/signal transduction histidine kinase/DNA-binding NarL/FixJ family response regulator